MDPAAMIIMQFSAIWLFIAAANLGNGPRGGGGGGGRAGRGGGGLGLL